MARFEAQVSEVKGADRTVISAWSEPERVAASRHAIWYANQYRAQGWVIGPGAPGVIVLTHPGGRTVEVSIVEKEA